MRRSGDRVPADLVGEREAAVILGRAPQTLRGWRCRRRDGPRFWKVDGRVRYSRRELSEWLDAHAVHAVSGGVPAGKESK